jgi:lipopolysaccharide biosynthesis glycosyltransferase
MSMGIHDQAAFNVALRGDWLELSPAMNLTLPPYNSFVRRAFPPSIVHFTGPVKPWSADYPEDHPVRADMLRWFANTPWPGFVRRPGFEDVWLATNRSGPQARALPQKWTFSPFADMAGMEALLKQTRFADIDQGITPLPSWPVLPLVQQSR